MCLEVYYLGRAIIIGFLNFTPKCNNADSDELYI